MSGKIVVVTGATGGLGPAVVARFRAAGDQVTGIGRSDGDIQADLTSPEDAARAIGDVIRQHGRIDALVHVMGGYAGGSKLWDTPVETWRKMLDLNLNSAFYVFRAAAAHMQTARRGRLIAVGSRAGVEPGAGMIAYSVSKAALHALVRGLAEELKEAGVTVNAVIPSTIDTPANRAWGSPEQQSKWVKPESIAAHVAWLASDEAGDVSGALLPVYGRA